MRPTTSLSPLLTLLLALFSLPISYAQFNFESFFAGHGHQQPQGPPQNAPSDARHYAEMFDNTHCTNFLCPATLACVHFPHHCPCAFPEIEDKVELGEGIAVCGSKGGFVAGEFGRKVELARRGVL